MTHLKTHSDYNNHVAEVYGLAQPGLMYMPTFGIFMTLELNDRGKEAKQEIISAVNELTQIAGSMEVTSRIVAGFSSEIWKYWTGEYPPGGPKKDSVLKDTDYFRDTQGDVFLYLKSEDMATCEELQFVAKKLLTHFTQEIYTTHGRMRKDRKILDHHFYDGITSPTDPAEVVGSIIRDEDTMYAGSSWAFTQKFHVKWDFFSRLNTDQKSDVIGRNEQGVIIPDDDQRSHIQRARVYNDKRENLKLVRQALPFGHSKTNAGRELLLVRFQSSKVIDTS